jgi:Tropomyosin
MRPTGNAFYLKKKRDKKLISVVCSMCKVLENRSQQDEERMEQLNNQLKEARLLAEDADGKSDEVSSLHFPSNQLTILLFATAGVPQAGLR